jgi:hypothetical protein
MHCICVFPVQTKLEVLKNAILLTHREHKVEKSQLIYEKKKLIGDRLAIKSNILQKIN